METSPVKRTESYSPAEIGVWVFILADMCIFAMYFGVFAWEKYLFPEQFALGQGTLNQNFGALNTVVLLVSSYFMASAVHSAREGLLVKYRYLLKMTLALGSVFLLVKGFEYTEKISAGFHIASNEFYRNYFAFTGFHLIHVLLGMSFLIWLLSFRDENILREKQSTIEGVGLYWHMVDLLWVVLFVLIYLVP